MAALAHLQLRVDRFAILILGVSDLQHLKFGDGGCRRMKSEHKSAILHLVNFSWKKMSD